MPIDVEWQDESGTVLARYDGPFLYGTDLNDAPPKSVCLRFIDPHGDTTFNQWQIEVLADELSALASQSSVDSLRSVANFIEQARGKMHTYVKFVGD
jgi:hypothetical protein